MYLYDPLYVCVLWSCEDWLCVFVSVGVAACMCVCLSISVHVYVRIWYDWSCLFLACVKQWGLILCICVSACPLFVSLSVCVSMNVYISSHARLKSPWNLFLLFLSHCLCLWRMGVCSFICVSMFFVCARANLKASYKVAADDKTFPYSLDARSQSETVKRWLKVNRTPKMSSNDPHRTFWARF